MNKPKRPSGRLGTSKPALQNIPIKTEAGAEIRRAFLGDSDRQFVSASYGEIELRALAHYLSNLNAGGDF